MAMCHLKLDGNGWINGCRIQHIDPENHAEQIPIEFQRIRLQTAKRAELHDFFERTLDLPVATSGNILQVQAGHTVLEFTDAAAGTNPYYHFAFNIPENRLAEATDWLRHRCQISKDPDTGQEIHNFVSWNAHSIYFHDPAGNLLEFIARHTLSNASTKQFNGQSILSISEIGLVAPKLSTLADRLQTVLGVHSYGPISSNFEPMGNEHGLFILVRTGHVWLGGTSQAEVHPVEVYLHSDHQQQLTWDDLPYLIQTGERDYPLFHDAGSCWK